MIAAASLLISWSVSALAADSDLEKIKQFDIPRQSADISLTEFAEQADITLIFSFDLAQEKTANRLVGSYRPDEAIRLLLQGTGLQPTFSSDGYINIAPDEDSVAEGDEMNRKQKAGLIAGLASLFTGPALHAQDSEQEALEEIVVLGSVSQSLAKQLDIKRNNTEFVDGLVAVDFAKFPDSNLGEALQRIPGIVVDRNDGGSQSNAIGEGSTINVRGLGPDFTRTEINGVTATNPGQQRGFGFNILASELFQSVVVQKSLSASDNEGGLAGTVTLNTYRPLSFDERVLTVSPRITHTELSEETSPSATVVYVDQFENDSVGIALVVNYSESSPQENSVNVANWDFLADSMRGNFALLTPAEQAQFEDVRIPRDPRLLVNSREQERINVAFTLEADVSDNFSIAWDHLYADLDHSGRQTRNDWPIEGFPATFLPPDIQVNGNQFVSGTFPAASHILRILDYEYDVQSSVYQTILTGEWNASDRLLVTPRLGYSKAEEDFEWNDFDVRSANTDIFYEFDGQFVTATPAIGAVDDPSLYTNVARIRNRPDIDEDQEFSFDLDFDLA
ncbi:MAG: TonB-dependent receptor plug domain-containing protein, partial [Rhodothermales bacterium]|nr:TonB-dependent receptor plug domain-containing protein [Rhodothermales bacterium]